MIDCIQFTKVPKTMGNVSHFTNDFNVILLHLMLQHSVCMRIKHSVHA